MSKTRCTCGVGAATTNALLLDRRGPGGRHEHADAARVDERQLGEVDDDPSLALGAQLVEHAAQARRVVEVELAPQRDQLDAVLGGGHVDLEQPGRWLAHGGSRIPTPGSDPRER